MANLMTLNAINFGSISTPKNRSLGFDGVPAPLAAILRLLTAWERRIRERDNLAQMDQRFLKDIGVSRMDAVAEIEKPFWHA